MNETAEPACGPHPAIYLVMYLPFGIASGYFSVTLGYLLSHAGVSTAVVAALVATLTWLQVAKIVWAPLVDTVWTYRGFYALACVTLSLGTAVTGLVAADAGAVGVLGVLALLIGAAMGLIGVTTNGLMARASAPARRGRAGGWAMAGNLGGSGIGGGLGLWIATHSALPWASAVVLGGLSLCGLAGLRFVREPEHAHRAGALTATLGNLAAEVWAMARSRPGALSLLIMVLPLGTGSAGYLFSAVAEDWRAPAGLVALVTGVLSGMVSAAGCIAGGYVCDWIERRPGYLLMAGLMAACTVAMAVLPKTPVSFAVLTLVYAGIAGMAYGACYAVVLEIAARGAAATKCDVLVSLSNVPIAAMTMIDGLARTRLGTDGMLLVESASGVLAIGLYLAVVWGTGGARRGVAVRV
jgi:MFS family permease